MDNSASEEVDYGLLELSEEEYGSDGSRKSGESNEPLYGLPRTRAIIAEQMSRNSPGTSGTHASAASGNADDSVTGTFSQSSSR